MKQVQISKYRFFDYSENIIFVILIAILIMSPLLYKDVQKRKELNAQAQEQAKILLNNKKIQEEKLVKELKSKVKMLNNFFETDIVSVKNLNGFEFAESFMQRNKITFSYGSIPSTILDGGSYRKSKNQKVILTPPKPYFIGTKKWSEETKKIFKANKKVIKEYIPLYDRNYKSNFQIKLLSDSGDKYNLRFNSTNKYFKTQRDNIKNGFLLIRGTKYNIPTEFKENIQTTYEQFKGTVNYYGLRTKALRRQIIFDSTGKHVEANTYVRSTRVFHQRYSDDRKWELTIFSNVDGEVIFIMFLELETDKDYTLNFANNILFNVNDGGQGKFSTYDKDGKIVYSVKNERFTYFNGYSDNQNVYNFFEGAMKSNQNQVNDIVWYLNQEN